VPVPWERHIKDTARGDEVIAPFLKSLPDFATLENYVDVNDLLAYLAAAAILMTTDGLVGGSGASDHYQYFDPKSGKFFVLPWDPDNTFGSQDEMPDEGAVLQAGPERADDRRPRFAATSTTLTGRRSARRWPPFHCRWSRRRPT
jgi:spore coat protein CotH